MNIKEYQSSAGEPSLLPEEHRPARPLLLYESNCPFCRRMAALVARLDRDEQIAMIPYDHPDVARFVVFLTEDQVRDSWRLYLPDGRRMTKGQAGTTLLELLGPTRLVGRALRRLRLEWLVGLVDKAVSRMRPLLSRIMSKDTEAVYRRL